MEICSAFLSVFPARFMRSTKVIREVEVQGVFSSRIEGRFPHQPRAEIPHAANAKREQTSKSYRNWSEMVLKKGEEISEPASR